MEEFSDLVDSPLKEEKIIYAPIMKENEENNNNSNNHGLSLYNLINDIHEQF